MPQAFKIKGIYNNLIHFGNLHVFFFISSLDSVVTMVTVNC